jgi:integrase/recombinase XerD
MTSWSNGDPLLDAFLIRLELAEYRPATLQARRSCLRSFLTTLQGRPLSAATRLDVEAFMSRALKPESRKAYKGHLRSFYRWALDEGYVAVDPTAKLAPVRVPRTVPRPISEADLITAVAAGDARMKAWLLLMALGGLRCIEVAGLRPHDVEKVGTGTILRLRNSKGGGVSTVPAHPLILDALDRCPIRDDAWWRLTPHRLSTAVGDLMRSVGINATAHQLRHYAGTSWYRASGHDLLATAVLLRHADVKTTMVYAQLDPVRPQQVIDAVSLDLDVEHEAEVHRLPLPA